MGRRSLPYGGSPREPEGNDISAAHGLLPCISIILFQLLYFNIYFIYFFSKSPGWNTPCFQVDSFRVFPQHTEIWDAWDDTAGKMAQVGPSEHREVGKQPGLSPTSHRQLWGWLDGSKRPEGFGKAVLLGCWDAGIRNPWVMQFWCRNTRLGWVGLGCGAGNVRGVFRDPFLAPGRSSQAGRAEMCHHPLPSWVFGKPLLTFTL